LTYTGELISSQIGIVEKLEKKIHANPCCARHKRAVRELAGKRNVSGLAAAFELRDFEEEVEALILQASASRADRAAELLSERPCASLLSAP
jgi:hypothetical protein